MSRSKAIREVGAGGGVARWGAGFTLIELLTVMVIVGILMAASGMALQGSLRSTQLTSASATLGNDLQLGVQLAVKENRPVELRIYKVPDLEEGGEAQFRAYQFVAREPVSGATEELEQVRRLSGGVIIHPNAEYTTVLTVGERMSVPGDPELGLEGAPYPYVGFQFRPDGSTTLPKDGLWSMTVAFEREVESQGGGLPANYRSVTINAYTGAVRVY